MNLAEARADVAEKQDMLDQINAAWSAKYLELQEAKASHRPPTVLMDLQHELNRLSEQKALPQQMLDGAKARLRGVERRAVETLKRQLVKEYGEAAKALSLQLATLMCMDQRLGITQYESAGLGGFRLPAYADQKADDTGALYSFLHLHTMFPEAEKAIEERLTREVAHV